jgi:predicted ATPase
MINRIYIDNYKCFSNFEICPGTLQLFLGENGTGKTAIFDILDLLRQFISKGLTTEEAFCVDDLTAWDTRNKQSFELGVKGNEGQYEYQVRIEHERIKRKSRIEREQLSFNKLPLYEFDGSEAHLFHDDGSEGPVFPFDWSRSAISTIPSRNDNARLTWFRQYMERLYVFSPDPRRMAVSSDTENSYPDRYLQQLVSWMRHLWQEKADFSANLSKSLKEVIEGLDSISLKQMGKSLRYLSFEFKISPGNGNQKPSLYSLAFDKLSDGQRNLIALYTILLAAMQRDTTVCLDEPDNFVTLREIQPWFAELSDKVSEMSGQCLLISHHPKAINMLSVNHGFMFSRDESGPARAKPFEWSDEETILPSELVARGWI